MSNNVERTDSSGRVVRVLRGGSWFTDASYCRDAFRDRFSPGYCNDFLGFRPANRVTKQCDKQH